jgi:hypothetical protein
MALAAVVLQLQRNGLALSQAYAARQNALELEEVITPERLTSMQGVQTSLATIDALEALVAEYRTLAQNWLVEASRQMAAVLEEQPEERRLEFSEGWMSSLQTQMQHQHQSQQARAEWIDAARTIFTMARRAREADPDAEGSWFLDEGDWDEFDRQCERIDAAAAVEVKLQEELAVRLRAGMEQLQPR